MNMREALGYLAQLKDLRRFIQEQPKLHQAYRRLTADQLQREPPARP